MTLTAMMLAGKLAARRRGGRLLAVSPLQGPQTILCRLLEMMYLRRLLGGTILLGKGAYQWMRQEGLFPEVEEWENNYPLIALIAERERSTPR